MDTILTGLPIFMIVGIVVVIGVSQFNRTLGTILGVVFWGVVLVLGLIGYDRGGAIGLPGIPFPKWGFVAMCLFFMGIHVVGAISTYNQRKRGALKKRLLEESYSDDDDDA